MPKLNKLDQLLAEHAALYKGYLTTVSGFQETAKRVLELQIEIFRARFAEAFPKAAHKSRPLIATISARQTPAELGKLLAELTEKSVEVNEVVYDPQHFSFRLHGKE